MQPGAGSTPGIFGNPVARLLLVAIGFSAAISTYCLVSPGFLWVHGLLVVPLFVVLLPLAYQAARAHTLGRGTALALSPLASIALAWLAMLGSSALIEWLLPLLYPEVKAELFW